MANAVLYDFETGRWDRSTWARSEVMCRLRQTQAAGNLRIIEVLMQSRWLQAQYAQP